MLTLKTDFRTYENVYLAVDKYIADDTISLNAWNAYEGPIARLTVCLADKSLEEDEAYIDTNNCPWAVDFLEGNGLAEPTWKFGRSGFCIYPVMKINLDEVKKHEYKG